MISRTKFLPILLVLCTSGLGLAHEVDQYELPECDNFEDLGDYWNATLYKAVRKGVESLNKEIEIAESIPVPAIGDLMLSRLHSEGTVAWRVRKHLPSVLMAIEGFEWKMRLGILPKKREDRIHGHRPSMFDTSYNHAALLPDIRQLNRTLFMRASLLKVHDKYIGTDKIGHFITHGYLYFVSYRAFRVAGDCHHEAVRKAVQFGKYGPVSEHFLVGTIPTGIYSNGDMAANYLGMKFFLSLMNPVMLQGCHYPSMLVRHGNYWKIRPHVTPEGDYFAAFISEHMDEVLNPSMFEPIARKQLSHRLRDRAPRLLAWYAGDDPAKRNAEYFNRLQRRYVTYFGEDYGHAGDDEQLLTLGELCFDERGRPIFECEPTRLADPTTQVAENDVNVEVLMPESHRLNQSESYTIIVENPRQVTMESVTFTMQIPAGLHVLQLDQPARFDRSSNSLTWRIGEFEQGARREFRFTAKAVKAGDHGWKLTARDGDARIGSGEYYTAISELSPAPDSRRSIVRIADRPADISLIQLQRR